ncbi:hypothetical protein PR048_016282 [Dryococelus australis]|uniref:Uncharacterized protein n=1 Tax=Dryococelus australis TaxID=614101 RepID=A0ABQ9HJR1_9NEOP|nr:hypothetical protein PR048_016282 [Dryococelus australis]
MKERGESENPEKTRRHDSHMRKSRNEANSRERGFGDEVEAKINEIASKVRTCLSPAGVQVSYQALTGKRRSCWRQGSYFTSVFLSTLCVCSADKRSWRTRTSEASSTTYAHSRTAEIARAGRLRPPTAPSNLAPALGVHTQSARGLCTAYSQSQSSQYSSHFRTLNTEGRSTRHLRQDIYCRGLWIQRRGVQAEPSQGDARQPGVYKLHLAKAMRDSAGVYKLRLAKAMRDSPGQGDARQRRGVQAAPSQGDARQPGVYELHLAKAMRDSAGVYELHLAKAMRDSLGRYETAWGVRAAPSQSDARQPGVYELHLAKAMRDSTGMYKLHLAKAMRDSLGDARQPGVYELHLAKAMRDSAGVYKLHLAKAMRDSLIPNLLHCYAPSTPPPPPPPSSDRTARGHVAVGRPGMLHTLLLPAGEADDLGACEGIFWELGPSALLGIWRNFWAMTQDSINIAAARAVFPIRPTRPGPIAALFPITDNIAEVWSSGWGKREITEKTRQESNLVRLGGYIGESTPGVRVEVDKCVSLSDCSKECMTRAVSTWLAALNSEERNVPETERSGSEVVWGRWVSQPARSLTLIDFREPRPGPQRPAARPTWPPRPATRVKTTLAPGSSTFCCRAGVLPTLFMNPMREKRGEYGAEPECKCGGNESSPSIVRHDPHMRQSGSDPAGNRTRFASGKACGRYCELPPSLQERRESDHAAPDEVVTIRKMFPLRECRQRPVPRERRRVEATAAVRARLAVRTRRRRTIARAHTLPETHVPLLVATISIYLPDASVPMQATSEPTHVHKMAAPIPALLAADCRSSNTFVAGARIKYDHLQQLTGGRCGN